MKLGKCGGEQTDGVIGNISCCGQPDRRSYKVVVLHVVFAETWGTANAQDPLWRRKDDTSSVLP